MRMNFSTAYRARIVAGLKDRHRTMEWLADRLKIHPTTLSRKMNGMPFNETEMRLIQKEFDWQTIGGEW